MTMIRRLTDRGELVGMDSRDWVRRVLRENKALHSGQRALLLLIVNQARNDWSFKVERSIVSTLEKNGISSGGSAWVAWYGAQSQADILGFSERHVRGLTDELCQLGLIEKLARPGKSSIIVFDTSHVPTQDSPGPQDEVSSVSDSPSALNSNAHHPGTAVPRTQEARFRLRNSSSTKRSSQFGVNDQVESVQTEILTQIRAFGRMRRSEVIFENTLSENVVEELGWLKLCNQSEYELRMSVGSCVRHLLNGAKRSELYVAK